MSFVALLLLSALASILVIAAFHCDERPEQIADGASAYRAGRLWAAISGEKDAIGLVDTGSSHSVFPESWPSRNRSSINVTTPFGTKGRVIGDLDGLSIASEEFKTRAVLTKIDYPIIGADILFSRANVLLSRSGLTFNLKNAPAGPHTCVPLSLSLQGNTLDSPVKDLHFLLKIDGAQQLVFFDTGQQDLLTATASAPPPGERLAPRMDLRFNALGEWALAPYYSRRARIQVGPQTLSAAYRHYHSERSVAAPFVMGAEILERFNIYIEGGRWRACFFPVS